LRAIRRNCRVIPYREPADGGAPGVAVSDQASAMLRLASAAITQDMRV
jgi:hypothetical protein